jgi:hypothetical protein
MFVLLQAAKQKQQEQEAARKKKAEEEAARIRKQQEEDASRKKKAEEEAAMIKKQQEAAEKKKKAEEEATKVYDVHMSDTYAVVLLYVNIIYVYYIYIYIYILLHTHSGKCVWGGDSQAVSVQAALCHNAGTLAPACLVWGPPGAAPCLLQVYSLITLFYLHGIMCVYVSCIYVHRTFYAALADVWCLHAMFGVYPKSNICSAPFQLYYGNY